MLLALGSASGAPAGQAFNVGTGRAATVLEIWDLVASAAGSTMPPRFGPPRAGDMRDASADTRRAASVLGFRARTGLSDGVCRLVRATKRTLARQESAAGR